MKEEKDDVVIEPEEAKTSFGSSPDDSLDESFREEKLAKMREELSACRKEKQEYMDGWQRAKADYVNALKRFEREAQEAQEKGKLQAVETLLPAFDALERAKEHGEVPQGFLAIARQLETAFATLGLEEVGKVGEKFDTAYHEALGQVAADSLETDDTIAVVLEKGWKIGDTVIRAAKVRVGHFANEKRGE